MNVVVFGISENRDRCVWNAVSMSWIYSSTYMGDEYTQLVASVQAATDGERSDPVVTQSALLS